MDRINLIKVFFAEKEDLVELVILENGGTSVDTTPVTSAAATTRRDPIERQKSFPKSYVASTHRSDWFDKMEVAGATATFATSDEVEDFVMVPSPDREVFMVEKISLPSSAPQQVTVSPILSSKIDHTSQMTFHQ